MTEFDPVTDFLTREQEALGELGSEINFSSQQASDVFANQPEVQENGSYVFLNGEPKPDGVSPVPPVSQPSGAGFILGDFQTPSGPDYPDSNEFFSTNVNNNSVFTNTVSEKNETWREAFNERIAQKDEQEEKLMAELKEAGRKELENWYKHYRNQLETRAKELREASKATENGDISGATSKPTVGDKDVWEKVCSMCDFQQGKQKTVPDMSRMRNVLLSLKPST